MSSPPHSSRDENTVDMFSLLSDDLIVEHILCRFDVTNLVRNISLVNWRFHQLCSDVFLWKKVQLGFGYKLDPRMAIRLLERSPRLLELKILDVSNSNGGFAAVYALQYCPFLEKLDVEFGEGLSMTGLLRTIGTCGANLRQLALRETRDGKVKEYCDGLTEHAEHLVNLTHLTVTVLTDVAIGSIADHCTKLEYFDYEERSEFNEEDWDYVCSNVDSGFHYFLDKMKHILYFRSSDCYSIWELGSLSNCYHLHTLRLPFIWGYEDGEPAEWNPDYSVLKCVPRMPSLATLELGNLTKNQLIRMLFDIGERKFEKLTDLEIRSIGELDGEVLEAIASNATKLRHLLLTYRRENEEVEVVPIEFDWCQQLKRLDLSRVKELDIEIHGKVAEILPAIMRGDIPFVKTEEENSMSSGSDAHIRVMLEKQSV